MMNESNDALHLIGYASAIAGVDSETAKGPVAIKNSPHLAAHPFHRALKWDAMLYPKPNESDDLRAIAYVCKELAELTAKLVKQAHSFCVLGGDHTAAIGTWSGVANGLKNQGDVGLVWVDAHMDSHTPETSETGRLHGMPLACLLGHGSRLLTSILNPQPKFKPEHVCLVGVRSFERGEAELLKRLNVRIFYMDEIKKRGLSAVMDEAIALVSQGTVGYGLSLDLDGFDPKDAPAVDVPEPDGIRAADMQKILPQIAGSKAFLGMEIVEFDPIKDRNHLTEQLIISFLEILANARQNAKESIAGSPV